MYKEINKVNHEREKEILSNWEKIDILEKTTKGEKNLVFYDGPAFANGYPGIHHMLGKFLKDAMCKYHTMNGYKILRKIGWDTHGLPIENHVEKKLGFTTKKEIEAYGLENFNRECRKSIKDNENEFIKLTKEMGQFIDTDNAYLTCNNEYIETEWWILKKFYDEGLFYEGFKILPYCTRCGTGLASHEVAQGYKEIDVDTVIVPMKKKDEDVYFLVWTTTPWTLVANVGLCVNPNYKYLEVISKGYHFIICESLAKKVLGEDFEIVKEYSGKDLEYMEYEQLLPFLDVDKKAFYVCCDEYVTDEDGTGIVHLAPAFGEDDSIVGKRYDLPYLNPVGEDGCYTEGPWKGMKVFDADLEVIKYLKENDKLFKKQRITHNYPHCWRCDTPLLYYSTKSYYLNVTKIKDKLIEANKKVEWFPAYVGEKRFANWLENLNDWAVSRTRFWGTPIPLWKCECGHQEMIGSEAELKEKAIEDITNLDFHRPYIDEIHITCPICGKQMTRIPEVLDCWFDSGAMPFAQYHYPFENKELWESQYPADFIAEGIDQTRGWFYSLLVLGVFVTGESPYKKVLVNELLLDKYGKKMHKSKGNAIEPFTLMNEYTADAIRWYLPYVSPVWTSLKFDVDGLREVNNKFFNTLKNTYNFFAMYANADNIGLSDFNKDNLEYEEIDKWLLSKYNKLVKEVNQAFEEYDLNKVVRPITDFVSEDLSNWYIRRNRRRFWKGELDNAKLAVYKVTYDVLVGLTKLIAPIAPFISEDIYKNLTGNESVHLDKYPKCDESLINEQIEIKMDLVRTLISLGRNAREEANIKIKQPLNELLLDEKNKPIINDLDALIKEELNVKTVVYKEDLSEYLSYEIKPNFKNYGKVFGKNIGEFQKILTNYNEHNLKELLGLTITLGEEEYTVSEDMLDIRVHSKEGFNTTTDGINYVVLDVTITKELENEGILRDLIRQCQVIRKNSGLDITDRIYIDIDTTDYLKEEIINKYKEILESELLATLKDLDTSDTNEFIDDLNNKYVIKMEKVSK